MEKMEEAGIKRLENMLFEILCKYALILTEGRRALQKAAMDLATKGMLEEACDNKLETRGLSNLKTRNP